MPNVAQRFMDCFPSLLRAFGLTNISRAKRRASDNKLEIPDEDKKFIAGTLTVALVEQHLAGTGRILGAVCLDDDGNVRWVCLDCDWYPVNHAQLEDEIERLRLPLMVCKSKSDGAHLYAFFTEPIPAALAIAKLEEWVALLIHLAPPGKKIEIFPKRPALNGGMGWYVNLPYYGGDKAENYGIRHGRRMPLEEFIARRAEIAIDRHTLESYSPRTTRSDNVKDFPKQKRQPPPSEQQQKKEHQHDDQPFYEAPPCCETLGSTGVGEGGRNLALYQFIVYLFDRYPNEWAGRARQYNQAYMRPPLSEQEVRVSIAGHKPNHRYKCHEEPMVSVCQREKCMGRLFGIGSHNDKEMGAIFPALKCRKSKSVLPPAVYALRVYGEWVEELSMETLENTRLVRQAVTNQLGIRVEMPPPKRWEAHLRNLINNHMITTVVGSGRKGEILRFLEIYCINGSKQETALLNDKPFVTEEITYLTYRGFATFLQRKGYSIRDTRDLESPFYDWCIELFGDKFNAEETKIINGKTILCFSIPSFKQNPSPPSSPPAEDPM